MKAVVQFSGGVGSWAAAGRSIERFGAENVTLLFADTKMEDEDLYRFLDDVEADLGIAITRICDGRTPWEVFRDVRFIGNSRADPCSKILKRDLLRAWIEGHCEPSTTVVLGIDWTEIHRFERAVPRWAPWTLWAPLTEETRTDKASLLAELARHGIRQPRLYDLGFPHNNCGGFCIKAGMAHFKLLLETMPERYAWHEAQEQGIRDQLGKDVTVLRDRSGGTVTPLTLRGFRERIEAVDDVAEAQLSFDFDDWGGCGCALE